MAGSIEGRATTTSTDPTGWVGIRLFVLIHVPNLCCSQPPPNTENDNTNKVDMHDDDDDDVGE